MVLQLLHQADLRFLLDGFVRRAVLANAESVVRPDELHGHLHQGSHSDGGLHVIAEDEERAASRYYASMKHHADAAASHRQLGNTCLQEVSAVVVARDDSRATFQEAVRLVGVAEVGRADNHIGHLLCEEREASG